MEVNWFANELGEEKSRSMARKLTHAEQPSPQKPEWSPISQQMRKRLKSVHLQFLNYQEIYETSKKLSKFKGRIFSGTERLDYGEIKIKQNLSK